MKVGRADASGGFALFWCVLLAGRVLVIRRPASEEALEDAPSLLDEFVFSSLMVVG